LVDKYVLPGGSDANNGNSWLKAYQHIQKGIDEVGSGETVHVGFGHYPENIKLKSRIKLLGYTRQAGQPILEFLETICPVPVIDGTSRDTTVKLENVTKTTIDNFNIVNGAKSNGAGILCISCSKITVKNCCIAHNIATQNGGGFYVENGTDIIFDYNRINDNNASNGGGGYVKSTNKIQLINQNSFVKNIAISSTSNINNGGGLYVTETQNFLMDKATFWQNNAGTYGGGICFFECDSTNPVAKVNKTTFSQNKAYGKRGGGACSINHAWVTYENCKFLENWAKQDGGGIAVQTMGSGASSTATTLTQMKTEGRITKAVSCEFDTNSCDDDGGGVYVSTHSYMIMNNCKLTENTSSENGGGVHCTMFSGVEISGGNISTSTASNGNGGGVSLRNATLIITGTRIENNKAVNGKGGGIYLHTMNHSGSLNAVLWEGWLLGWGYNSTGSTVSVNNATISNNISQLGGGICIEHGRNIPFSVSIQGCNTKGNRAKPSAVYPLGTGGGFYLQKVHKASILGNQISTNLARDGAGMYLLSCNNPTITGNRFSTNIIRAPPGIPGSIALPTQGTCMTLETCTGISNQSLIQNNQGVTVNCLLLR
jgi:parallel beta-helix repeat protein